MCRWLVYKGRPIFLEDLVTRPNHSIISQSIKAYYAKIETNGDGFGIGWYDRVSEPGVIRSPYPAWNSSILLEICRQVMSPLFFAHVRAATGTEVQQSNCHPFKYGNWLFMHNGQINNYQNYRRAMEKPLSDKLYRMRRGTTDSELIFLLIINNGLAENPVRAVIKTIEFLDEISNGNIGLRFSAAIANGKDVYIFRYSSDNKSPSLYYSYCEGDLTIASEPLDNSCQWQIVEENKFLITKNNNKPKISVLYT